MFALIQSKNYVSNKGKSVGRYQYGTHPTRIGLNEKMTVHFGCKATKKNKFTRNYVPEWTIPAETVSHPHIKW